MIHILKVVPGVSSHAFVSIASCVVDLEALTLRTIDKSLVDSINQQVLGSFPIIQYHQG